MLSRVAENLYWLGRYVERTENTARAVMVNANLLLDLPKGFAPGWRPLVAVTGSEDLFNANYDDYDERSVVRFLVGDREYPSSIISCLASARENTRTVRDIIPRESWELVNELFLYARDELQSGLARRGRYNYLRQIIRETQTLAGLLSGTMSHDAGYEFLMIGRTLERGDMTTRIIDVRTATLLGASASGLLPFENIQWISVLKSLTAYQMYRRKMQVRVRRADALRYLLLDDEFPRAFHRCVLRAEESVRRLPRNEDPLRSLARVKRQVRRARIDELVEDQTRLHDFVDELQLGLARAHDALAGTYFLPPPPA